MLDNISEILNEAVQACAVVFTTLLGAWFIYALQDLPRAVVLGMLKSQPDETRKLSTKIFYVAIVSVISIIIGIGCASSVGSYRANRTFFIAFLIFWLPMVSGIYKGYRKQFQKESS